MALALKQHDFEEYKRLSNEQALLGKFNPIMTHSFSEKAHNVVFHAQVLADWNTIVEIAGLIFEEIEAKQNTPNTVATKNCFWEGLKCFLTSFIKKT